MRVISMGWPEPAWKAKVDCPTCKAHLAITDLDVRTAPGMWIPDRNQNVGRLWVECPTCSEQLVLLDVPALIEMQIMTRRTVPAMVYVKPAGF